MKKYLFKLPIGDWSNDGHGKCEHFIIQSNVPIEEVFDAYFKAREELPDEICPENICENYQESYIKPDIFEKLKEYGFNCEFEYDNPPNNEGNVYIYPDDMLKIVLWFIKQGNNKIKLKVIKLDKFINWEVPKKHKGKDLGGFGYGLFE